jgi:hypothetical protein
MGIRFFSPARDALAAFAAWARYVLRDRRNTPLTGMFPVSQSARQPNPAFSEFPSARSFTPLLTSMVVLKASTVAGPKARSFIRLDLLGTIKMAKSIGTTTTKKRGRPAATVRGAQVGERWHPTELAAIDAWIAASTDRTISRAHAIRRLVARGLRAETPSKLVSKSQKPRAPPSWQRKRSTR